MMNKKELSERDICTKFITPAIKAAGWNIQTPVIIGRKWVPVIVGQGHVGTAKPPYLMESPVLRKKRPVSGTLF